MLDYLISIDKKLFLFLNGFHNDFWDQVMWYISESLTWLPLYLAIIIYLFYKQNWKFALLSLVIVIPLMFASDSGSVHLFKNVFERLRPCHDPELSELIHNVRRCGGRFGFISSHASNVFGIALYFHVLFRNSYWSVGLLAWAALVSYSRVYLGVHFPGDIMAGAVWGVIWGWVFARLTLWSSGKIFIDSKLQSR